MRRGTGTKKKAPPPLPSAGPGRHPGARHGELPVFTFKKALPGQPSGSWGRALPVGPGPELKHYKKVMKTAVDAEARKQKLVDDYHRLAKARDDAMMAGDAKKYLKLRKKHDIQHAKLTAAGVIGKPRPGITGWLEGAGQAATDAAIFAPYGMAKTGEAIGKDEWSMLHGKAPTETPKMAKALGAATLHDIRHPTQPESVVNLGLDAFALASMGLGTGIRVAKAGEAFGAAGRTAEVAGEATRAVKPSEVITRPTGPYRVPKGLPNAGKFAKRPETRLTHEVGQMEKEFAKRNEYQQMKANLRAQEAPPGAPLRTRIKAALTRPGYEGGSLLHRPPAGESPIFYGGKLVAHRLEPDNPLLRPVHASHAKRLQKHLDAIADGKSIPKGHVMDTAIKLLGGAPKIVGREVRATGRINKDLQDVFEARLPEGTVPKDKAPPPGHLAAGARVFNRPFRVFGVYLAPKYIATNLTGNMTMGVATQGVAKISANMYRARRIEKTHGAELTHDIRHEVGISRTESTVPGSELAHYEDQALPGMEHPPEDVGSGKPSLKGRYRHLEEKAVHGVMAITDRDFRTASWLYRAREKGYITAKQQHDLIHSHEHAHDRDAVAKRARKDAVDFNSLTPREKAIVEGVYFYPWLSRATAWTGRTIANRPAKSAVIAALGRQGHAASKRELGDQPEWMKGYIKTAWGLVNPSSVTTPSTPAQVAQQLKHPLKNLFAQPGASIEPGSSFGEEFGTPAVGLIGGQSLRDLGSQIAAVGALNRAGHPLPLIGRPPAKTFPHTGLWPALGPFLGGGLYPRRAKMSVAHEQAARERFRNASPMERIGIKEQERLQRIPAEYKAIKKMKASYPGMIAKYKGDLDALKHLDEFKLKAAQKLGSSSYRSLPPANKIDVALSYLEQHHGYLDNATIASLKDSAKYYKGDQAQTSYANSLFRMSSVGQYKSSWDSLVRQAPKHTKKLK